MPDSRAFSPVSTTSTAYVFSRKARAMKLATFRSSSTNRIRIDLPQYHRTLLAPHQTKRPPHRFDPAFVSQAPSAPRRPESRRSSFRAGEPPRSGDSVQEPDAPFFPPVRSVPFQPV